MRPKKRDLFDLHRSQRSNSPPDPESANCGGCIRRNKSAPRGADPRSGQIRLSSARRRRGSVDSGCRGRQHRTDRFAEWPIIYQMFSDFFGELQVLDRLLIADEDIHIRKGLLDVAARGEQPSHLPGLVPPLVQFDALAGHVLLKLLQSLQLPTCVGLLRPSLEEQPAYPLPLSDAEVVSGGGVIAPVWAEEEGLFGDLGVVGDGVELSVHLNLSLEYKEKEKMAEQNRELRLSHQDITAVFQNLLALPRTHRSLHPSQERSKYAELNEWLRRAMADVVHSPRREGRTVCEQQQRIILALLEQLSEMGRRECAEKGALLSSVKQYLIGTLNAYWVALSNANKEIWYEFQNNSVRAERQYISELKRLQAQVEQLRRDKDHRWRNMFMLIKDNRIHRRQNKKLLTSISYQIQKNVALAQQMILLREQNQKLKIKLGCFQNDPIRIESFAETELKLLKLKQSIRGYPKRCKKILRGELFKIQIQQINNIDDKINFIIKAIEETGEIIDEFYDQENIWSNFQYNISTQTEPLAMDQKATNTPVLKVTHSEAWVTPAQLVTFQVNQTYNLMVRGLKKDRKDARQRQGRVPMFSSTYTGGGRLASRREDAEKVKELTSRHKLADSQLSICESVKMTIYNGRISYISTYNIEIINGQDILRRIEQKIQSEAKTALKQIKVERVEMEVQTDDIQELPMMGHSQMRLRTKFSTAIALPSVTLASERAFPPPPKPPHSQLKIYESVNVEINSMKGRRSYIKVKFAAIPQNEKEALFKTNLSDQVVQSSRNSSRSKKRLNNFQQYNCNTLERENILEKRELSTQTQQPTITVTSTSKGKDVISIGNIDSKDQPAQTNHTSNSNNSSFLQELKNPRKNIKNKVFNQSMDSFLPLKPKSKQSRHSDISPLKNIEPKKMQKISRVEMAKHKRTSTGNSETQQIIQNTLKTQQIIQNTLKTPRQLKMKPLHRISQVLTQGDLTRQDPPSTAPVKDKLLPMIVTRQGEIRGGDFAKSVQKIIRSMYVRRNQIISNCYSLKAYLSSYFKCIYGREIYPSFLRFLNEAEPQESVICFSRLANPTAPQPYLIDIFKAFVKAVGKCYILAESPCSQRLRQEILKYLAGLFLQEQEINGFALRMRNKGCYTLMGWFISLEQELWLEAIHSELYSLLSLWVSDAIDFIAYDFIEELSYFMQADPLTHQFLIKCKVFLGDGVPLHRFCLFSYRYRWQRMLQLRMTIQDEYLKRVGTFEYEEAIKRIQHHRTILLQFKHLERCFRQAFSMCQRYGTRIDPSLLMLSEMNIQEYKLKNQMPLSRELKYLSLAFEGLQKKKEFQTFKTKLQCGMVKQNMITSKATF